MTHLDGIPAAGLAGATRRELETRRRKLEQDLEREERRLDTPPNEPDYMPRERRRVLAGALRRVDNELAIRNTTF